MKKICYLSLLFVSMMMFGSCEKDYLTRKEVEITTPVSFATDVLPFLIADCATPTCHVSGAVPPDLSAAKAYDELTGLGYVDTLNAISSILYVRITATNKPMPPTDKLSPEEIGYVLAWIKQGAQNN